MNRYHISLFLALWVCTSTTALAEPELESNNTLDSAQTLVMSGDITIEGELTTGDVDFFSFYGMPNDKIEVEIDQGIGGVANVNTYIAVFDQDGLILHANDDATTLDEGSISLSDSHIDAFTIANEGWYVIGVTNYASPFLNGGAVSRSRETYETTGDYVLNINYIAQDSSPTVEYVTLRVSPGNVNYRPLNSHSMGTIKVAILSTIDFDASVLIDPSSLTFGATGTESQVIGCRSKNVDREFSADLVCKFSMRNSGLTSFHDAVKVKGQTIDGTPIDGSGYIKMRKYHRGYHDEHRYRKNKGHSSRRHHDDD